MATTTEDYVYDDYTTYPEYKAGILIWKVVPPILIVVGTIGNLLSIVVLTRRSIRVSTTALYLTFLACSDLVVLYSGLLRQWLLFLWEYDLRHMSETACKLNIWLVYSSLDFSAWILIAVTLERVISAWCPYSAKTKCSRKYATALIITVLVFLLGLNSHLLYGMVNRVNVDESGNVTEILKCREVNQAYGDFFNLIWPWIDLAVFCLIPFSVIVVGNGCILFKVIKSQRKTNSRIVPSITTNQSRTTHHNGPKHSSMTAMLFTLNMVFLFTTSPVSIYNIGYTHWVAEESHQNYANLDLWWAIVNMLMYTNNSLNFLLYCLSGTRFRQEVKRLFTFNFNERSDIALDIYTRTKFNTQVPTATPSHTPDRDISNINKNPNALQIPDMNTLHSSDTSGFGSCNSLHPSSALQASNRTTSVTGIAVTNGSASPVLDHSPGSPLHCSPNSSPKSSHNLQIPPNSAKTLNVESIETDERSCNSIRTLESLDNEALQNSVKNFDSDKETGVSATKEMDTNSSDNLEGTKTFQIPTISQTLDEGIHMDSTV